MPVEEVGYPVGEDTPGGSRGRISRNVLTVAVHFGVSVSYGGPATWTRNSAIPICEKSSHITPT